MFGGISLTGVDPASGSGNFLVVVVVVVVVVVAVVIVVDVIVVVSVVFVVVVAWLTFQSHLNTNRWRDGPENGQIKGQTDEPIDG